MREIAQEVLNYFQEGPILFFVIALAAGFTASKTVAYERKGNFFLYLIIGMLGCFLGQFAILLFGLNEIIGQLPKFRILFDFIAAYVGSFVLAAIIHFIRPL
jgi:uncharacterized membrane protein YeaQ/YmgE (transglycosylase-associated protein family)